jgi:GGDEF domain-containing protein
VLRDVVRVSDVVGLWGGDEFAVFVARGADAPLEAVRACMAERLEQVNAAESPYLVVSSLGAALTRVGERTTLTSLIAQADASLN